MKIGNFNIIVFYSNNNNELAEATISNIFGLAQDLKAKKDRGQLKNIQNQIDLIKRLTTQLEFIKEQAERQ